MADRDPETIRQDIDQARDQLAVTVDNLAERANPRRIADEETAGGDLDRRYRRRARGPVRSQAQALIRLFSAATPIA